MYIYIYIHVCIYIYIERERDASTQHLASSLCLSRGVLQHHRVARHHHAENLLLFSGISSMYYSSDG